MLRVSDMDLPRWEVLFLPIRDQLKNLILNLILFNSILKTIAMQTSRRNFIKSTGLTVAGLSVLRNDFFTDNKKKKLLGLQLYSVRDDMQKDPMGTLKQLAEMGYKNVEHANYVNRKFYGWTAQEFKKRLKDLGMKMPSGHTVMQKAHWDETKKDFTDAWKWTVEDAAEMGQKIVISPWLDESMRKTADDLKRYMEVFNKSGELCKKSAMKFGYHNHDFEFSVKLGDKTVYDIILGNTDPNLVAQQLDTGNMYHTGARAQDIIKKYPGRFESMHVKDEIKTDKGEMGSTYESAILGTGVVGMKEVLDLGKSTGGTIHFIIEQESYQGKAPVECMKENYAIMKGWGY
jgi:sugar phosphate isomerase/epimerase